MTAIPRNPADPVVAERARLSAVIPTLNEAGCIGALLSALQPLRDRGHELIVVDGGSTDGTPELAAERVDRVLHTPAGRAGQMQAGAGHAHGDILWFLHADSCPPPAADTLILQALRQTGSGWGRFDIELDDPRPSLRTVSRFMNLRSRLTGIATGDQGMFVTRAHFEAVGGFPGIPLMEDIRLSHTLKHRFGRPACLPERLLTSARRWRAHGVTRTILTMWGLRLAHFLGVSPTRLARIYAAGER